MAGDWRDMADAMLAEAELDALDCAAGWRAVARAAINQLHEQRQRIERQDAAILALREELRRFTLSVITQKEETTA